MFQRSLFILFGVSFGFNVLCVKANGFPSASARQGDGHQESQLDRQWDSSLLVPNMFVSTLMPLSIMIGIGIILVKLFILCLWIYGRSGAGIPAGYTPGYPGYSLTTAYSHGWRGDSSSASARSMVDRNGSLIPPYIGSKVLSLVSKVTEALDAVEKRQKDKSS
ncbi:uncharacterized protein LOC141852061 [Brevipalpus obovatus]|uniref:uncharacterized protein LOC141852061 n=1 Tax=Brevipalpus obovatus TaxID=246614 RepID=UPI003D9DD928